MYLIERIVGPLGLGSMDRRLGRTHDYRTVRGAQQWAVFLANMLH